MGDGAQRLFLAEFLVDKVNIPSIRAMHKEMLPSTTCVSFQILNLPPINIYQDSSSENCSCPSGDTQIFKKGKSCLFALPTIVLEKSLQSFPINMSVYKKLPPGVLPDVMLIGSYQIETKDLINVLLDRRIFKSGNPCKTMKDTFIIKTATGQHVGEVTVFLRISCFGEKIVTQFQIPHNKKPYLFKGVDNSPVFQCKRIPSNLEENINVPTRCNCEPNKIGSRAAGSDNIKSCCPIISSPPACPPPTRRHSPINSPSRPCCPSSRGQKCPAALSAETNLRSSQPPRAKIRQKTSPQTRKCGCPPNEQKICSCS